MYKIYLWIIIYINFVKIREFMDKIDVDLERLFNCIV